MFATYLSGFLSHSLFARLIPRWGLGVRGLVFYTSSWISIAVAIRFLDPTLGLLEAGRISIALIIHSLDRGAHPTNALFKQALKISMGTLSRSLATPLITPCSVV